MIRKGQNRTRKGNPALPKGRALQLPSISTPSATDTDWASIANVAGVPYWTTSSGATEMSTGGGGSGGPRIYPADADDILVWELQEAAGATTAVNTGTASSANLTKASTEIEFDHGGPFGRAAISSQNATDALYGASAVAQPAALTMSIWVRWHTQPGVDETMLCKAWATGAWSAPYVGAQLAVDGPTDKYIAIVIVGGARVICYGPYPSTLDSWTHVGMTCDGTTIKLYINGREYTQATGGTVQGGSGHWMVGGAYYDSNPFAGCGAYFRSARVANVVRPQSWFKAVYAYGIGEPA